MQALPVARAETGAVGSAPGVPAVPSQTTLGRAVAVTGAGVTTVTPADPPAPPSITEVPLVQRGERTTGADPARAAEIAPPLQAEAIVAPAAAQPASPAPSPVISASAAAPGTPHDFAALVDRLVEARATAMAGQPVQVVQTHLPSRDFGPVSLRFDLSGEALSVSLSSADPEFNRAVLAAATAEPGLRNESGSHAPGQGQSHGSAQAGSGHAQSGQPSHGQTGQRNSPPPARSGQDETATANQPRDQQSRAPRSRGLFA